MAKDMLLEILITDQGSLRQFSNGLLCYFVYPVCYAEGKLFHLFSGNHSLSPLTWLWQKTPFVPFLVISYLVNKNKMMTKYKLHFNISSNSLSFRIFIPSSTALSYFEPGFLPATT